jgi:hypothetical protein
MKKILMIFLVLLANSLWSNESLSDVIDVESSKIIEKFNDENVDAIVVGKVINVSVEVNKRRPEKELSINNIFSITTVEFEVKESYKQNTIENIINVVIPGGRFIFDDKVYIYASKSNANPLLDEGDIVLMGLKKLENGNYKHVFGKELQIPFSDNLIDDIENQTKEHKLKKLKKLKEKQIENNSVIINTPNENEILENSLKESIKRKSLIKEITKKLNLSFSKSEVINE